MEGKKKRKKNKRNHFINAIHIYLMSKHELMHSFLQSNQTTSCVLYQYKTANMY